MSEKETVGLSIGPWESVGNLKMVRLEQNGTQFAVDISKFNFGKKVFQFMFYLIVFRGTGFTTI